MSDERISFADGWHVVPDGLSIHYRDYAPAAAADAAPVLCLHGLTRNARDFEELAPRIAALGRRVIVPEQRGRGRSEWDPDAERYAPANYAVDMVSLLDELSLGRVVIIGTSMGGLMAMIIAAVAPDRLAGVILNDIGPEIGEAGLDRIKGYVGGDPDPAPDWAEAARRARALNGAAFPHEGGDEFWLAFARRLYREDDDGRPRLDYDPAIGGPMRADGEPLDLWPLFDAFAEIPALLVYGEISDILSAETAERMRTRKPDLAVEAVPGVGHAPFLTEPAAWSAVSSFLKSVD